MPTKTFFKLPQEKQIRIIDSAILEFGERNLVEGNISNIIKTAKIPRGSFYQYFESKDDLYIYIFDHLRYIRDAAIKDVYSSYTHSSFLNFFRSFYLKNAEFLLEHPSHINLGKNLYTCKNQICSELVLRQQLKYKDLFIVAIEADKSSGKIKPDTNAPTLADLCVHLCTDTFIFESILSNPTIEQITENIDEILSIFSHGISL